MWIEGLIENHPMFVILPTSIQEQVSRRETFLYKANTLSQTDGSKIVGLNIGFEAMQSQVLKSKGELSPTAHEKPCSLRRLRKNSIGRANMRNKIPQGLKAHIDFAGLIGPTKVVPWLQSPTRKVFRSL